MAACAGLMLGALLTTLVELLLLATLAELLLRVALWPALPFGLVRGCDDDRLAFTFAGRFVTVAVLCRTDGTIMASRILEVAACADCGGGMPPEAPYAA